MDGCFNFGVDALSFCESRIDLCVSLVEARVPVVMTCEAIFKLSAEATLFSVGEFSPPISVRSLMSLSLPLRELSFI